MKTIGLMHRDGNRWIGIKVAYLPDVIYHSLETHLREEVCVQEVEQEDYKTNQSAPVTTPICQKSPEMETCDTKCGIVWDIALHYCNVM